MKLYFQPGQKLSIITLLANRLNIELDEAGLKVELVQREGSGGISIIADENKATLYYDTEVQLFRGIGHLVQQLRAGHREFHYNETQHIKTVGVMLDCSRNAVLSVATVKELLSTFAFMGINMVMLYTEDTYEIEERPYFGYMRGKYTIAELQELDDVAANFGIELVPCIQTLGHMKMGLQWADTESIRDGDDVMLIDEPKTYEVIKQMLTATSQAFRSKRIHIGMDEAYQVGRGTHLDRFGHEERFSLMNRHLNRVLELTDTFNLKPMIWSDMFFGSSFLQEHTEESFVTDDMIASLPKQVQYVYWDYFSEDPGTYRHSIQKHKSMGQLPMFAGGIWIWPSIAPNYGKSFATTEAAMQVCREEGIEEVFATLWGDNGQETNIMAGLLGIQLYAEYAYAEQASVDRDWLDKRFELCTSSKLNDFYSLTYLDEVPGVMEHNLKASNPSKFLLYQDLLIPLFDADITGLPLSEHYKQLTLKLEAIEQTQEMYKPLFAFYTALSSALEIKSEISLSIKALYDVKDKANMQQLVDQELVELEQRITKVQELHRQLWFTYNKPFGWEVQDIRYGGILARIRSSKWRLQQWICSQTECLEELDAVRLPYNFPAQKEEGSIGRGHLYHRIVTAANFSG